MKSIFDTLNLSPQERRFVVGVLVVLFVFLNFWLVWPHFSDWKEFQMATSEAEEKLVTYTKEAALKSSLQTQLADLEDSNSTIPSGDQTIFVDRMIRRLGTQTGVNVINVTGRPGTSTFNRTNDFFVELFFSVNVDGNDKQIVNFLHSLGTSNSLIRVRDMSLRPDQTQTKLVGDLTLIASYQKDLGVAPAPKSK